MIRLYNGICDITLERLKCICLRYYVRILRKNFHLRIYVIFLLDIHGLFSQDIDYKDIYTAIRSTLLKIFNGQNIESFLST